MEKKMTVTLGIALGATLLAGAGLGLYKWLSKKKGARKALQNASTLANEFTSRFIGNSLVKSNSLYGSQNDNGLVGGGLVKPGSGSTLVGIG